MSNRDAPFGFVPIGTTDGSDYHGKMMRVQFNAAANGFVGDMTTLTGTTQLAASKYPVVAIAPAADLALVGAIVEFYPDFTDEGSLITNFAPSGSPREARVMHGTRVIYSAQADDIGVQLDGSDITAEVDLSAADAGDQITGISGQQLDSSTAGTTGAQLIIVGGDENQGNLVGSAVDGANAQWNVVIAPAALADVVGG